MNKIIIAAFALIAVNLPCFSNTPVQAERSESLFDLFYGMTTDSLNSYCDPVLDKIPGLIHEEFSSEWYYPTDSLKSLVSVGIYIDREFPSENARKTILSKASTEIANSFVCIAFEWPQSEQVTKRIPTNISTEKYLEEWRRAFDGLTASFGYKPKYAGYQEIFPARGCTVVHKIYEDDKYSTYIIEESTDCHGSCGCPSYANYFTVDNNTGKVLTINDIAKMRNISSNRLGNMLIAEYERVAKEKGATPIQQSAESMLQQASGAAIINEGILVYYVPYTIGCGAEGQYNLVIPIGN